MSTYLNSETHKQSARNASAIAANTKEQCKHCAKEYVRGNIAKHEESCSNNPTNDTHCRNCAVNIKRTLKFCSKSCSAVWNNANRQTLPGITSFLCLGCSIEHPLKKNRTGRYCSNKCHQNHAWETITKPSILRGERTKTDTIRRFLIERDGPGCSVCETVEWRGKPMTMDVDHIDGDHTNNQPENFRLICPNCHRQTPTWGKKNPKRYGTSSLRYTPV